MSIEWHWPLRTENEKEERGTAQVASSNIQQTHFYGKFPKVGSANAVLAHQNSQLMVVAEETALWMSLRRWKEGDATIG